MDLAFDPTTTILAPALKGVFQGVAYGLIALGIVLLYKSNGIFNFAQGEFAGSAAFMTLLLYTGYSFWPKLPYGFAVLAGLTFAVFIALLTEQVVIKPLFHRPKVVLLVGTVGVALLLIALEGIVFPGIDSLPSIDRVLGIEPIAFRLGRVAVLWHELMQLAVLVVLAIAAFLFFKLSRTGTAILAVSQDSTAAAAVGIPVRRISRVSWGLAGLLGGIAGIMLSVPPNTLVPGVLTGSVLTAALAAAVVGGISSLPGAFVGGILLGLIKAFAGADVKYIPGLDQVKAVDDIAVALVLVIILLVRPRGLLGRES